MRIGIDIRELARGRMTGIGRYLRNFIAYASAARPGHRFYLYGNQYTEPPPAADNQVVRLQIETATLWWDQVVLPRLASQDRVEVFLSPYVKGPVRVKCPLAITIHDLIDLAFPADDRWRDRLRKVLFRRMARWVGRRADLIIADSVHSAKDIEVLLGLDPAKIQVLPIGLEETYRPVEEAAQLQEVRRRYGIEVPYILYLGNCKPHKNVQGLIQAFARLDPELREGFSLVIAGRPDRWTGERQLLAERLGLGGQVRFIGAVAEVDMPALYSAAELFVFPSLYEGFGLPPLEAMACGAPVVASNRTSIPEVVGEAGLLVDPEDVEALSAAMARLLGDEKARDHLRQKGLEQAQHFRLAVLGERQLRLLEGLAEAGR